ncbi:hypothetical protein ACEPAG_3788 [Sanghuangporus baumii]
MVNDIPKEAAELRAAIIQKLRERNIPEYNPEQLERAPACGHGTSGAKSIVYWKMLDNGQGVAVKCLTRSVEKLVESAEGSAQEKKRERLFQYFERECVLWHRGSTVSAGLQDPRVVKLLGFVTSYDNSIFPSLVLELHSLGDLRTLVSQHPELSDKERIQLLRDAACGIAYLHDPTLLIVHRDIKGSNIMVRKLDDGRLVAAIGDFGAAKLMDPEVFPIQNSSTTPSLCWTPPEYIVNGLEDYSKPTIHGDIWSFACTVIEILSNADPWHGFHDVVMHLMGEAEPPYPPAPSRYKGTSPLCTFLRSCLQPPADERPTGRLLEAQVRHLVEAS